jgi:alpha-tubulin suppressor-like RCC1 family protein
VNHPWIRSILAAAATTLVSLGLAGEVGGDTFVGIGNNGNGQLGDGTTIGRPTPVQVVGPGGVGVLAGIRAVAAGMYHTVALKSDGTVWSCGWNLSGQLGDGTTTSRTTPVQVLGPSGTGVLRNVQAVAGGYGHTLALKTDGTVWAWGWNETGRLGDGTTLTRHAAVQVVGPGGSGFLNEVRAVAAGYQQTLAVKKDGTVWAWGGNFYGQLGDGTTTNRPTPVQVVGPGGSGFLNEVRTVTAGWYHTVVLKNDGTVWAWGDNRNGQLGDGTTTRRSTPVQVVGPGGVDFLNGVCAVSAVGYHTVALKSDGTVWTWGYNNMGQLGDGTTLSRTTPVQVVGLGGAGFLSGVRSIAAGYAHTVALMSDGAIWTWGYNNAGQLGDGTTTNRSTPGPVVGLGGTGTMDGFHAVSASGYHTLALSVRLEVTAELDWNWVYQNAALTTADRHKSVMLVEIAEGTIPGQSYRVTVQEDGGAMVNFRMVPAEVNKLLTAVDGVIGTTLDLFGGRTDNSTAGTVPHTLTATVSGSPGGQVATADVPLVLRRLGDIDGDGLVNSADKLEINKCLNGLATLPGITLRDLDLTGDGALVNAEDKLAINQVLNGLTVP